MNSDMTRSEVAELFHVDPKTVTRWEKEGKLVEVDVYRTLGGHRRYPRNQIMAIAKKQGMVTEVIENG